MVLASYAGTVTYVSGHITDGLERPWHETRGIDFVVDMENGETVTVRTRGVMEKCSYCIQRIRRGKETALKEGRPIRDGEVLPACAQTCPTNVIAFGNIDDPSSRVAHIARSGRAFRVFEELNTQSGIVYLKKVAEGGTEGAAH